MSRHVSSSWLALAAVAALASACPDDGEDGGEDTPSGLAGEWRASIVSAGTVVAGGTGPGWTRARLTVAGDGTVTVQETLDALGRTALPTVPIRCAEAADGSVTLAEGPWTDYLGQRSGDARVWVSSATNGPMSQLRINQRVVPGVAFAQADLAGTWHYHAFTTGSLIRWEHGRATIAADGATTLSARVSSADGPLEDEDVGRLLLGADGRVTTDGADASWAGVLSAGKDLLVATHTAPSSGHAYEVLVVSRVALSAATADLAGAWKLFTLEQDAGGGGWSRVTATIGAAGVVTLSGYEDSHGGTLEVEPIAVAVAADGTIAQEGNPRWHGALVGDDLWVAVTDRDEGTQASLFVGIR